jgi:hypothetical protein
MESEKMVNIYDKEKNPNESCDKIKNEWNLSCNQIIKEKNNIKKFNNSLKCQILFQEYSNCYIQHLINNSNRI